MIFVKDSYYQEKFKKVSLSMESISDIEFEECVFMDCSFVDCSMERCRFINCRFDGCMISALKPIDSRFVDVSFVNSKVMGFDWTVAQHIDTIGFEKCFLDYSNFRLLILNGIKIVACEAREVDFTEADLTGSNLEGTDFERSIFSKTNLTRVSFRGATNYRIDVRSNMIKGAQFSLPEAISLLDSLDVVIE